MSARFQLLIVCGLVGGCHHSSNNHSDAAGGGMATGTVTILNGASPGAAPHFNGLVAPVASDGTWEVSPNKLRVPITGIQFIPQGMSGGPVQDVSNCAVTFDITQPGLAQTVSCPFTLPAGTYTGAGPRFDNTYDILIDDPVNGIYTDPTSATKLSLTAPAGGGQTITVPNPIVNMGGIAISKFATPLTVHDGDTVSVSMLIGGLQSIQLLVSGGTATFGPTGSGNAGAPAVATSVGTPAAVAYYVNGVLGTPYNYNLTTLGPSYPYAISVEYTSGGSPAFLGMSRPDLPNCGPTQVLFVFPGKGSGYLGLDASGTLGWASFSDSAGTMYSAVMAMQQVTALNATTTFKCLNTTTDPMPSGDSFSSGAPNIPTPTHTETMKLVAK